MSWLDLPLYKLPGIFSMNIQMPPTPGDPIYVAILLKGYRRADVAKWARHFGSEVVEGEPRRQSVGDGWERHVETAHEARGFRIHVRTTVPVKAPVPVGSDGGAS